MVRRRSPFYEIKEDEIPKILALPQEPEWMQIPPTTVGIPFCQYLDDEKSYLPAD